MTPLETELAVMRGRAVTDPESPVVKRRLKELEAAVKAEADAGPPVIEVVDEPMEVETATLPKAGRKPSH